MPPKSTPAATPHLNPSPEEIEVDNHNLKEVLYALRGRAIVAIERAPDSPAPYQDSENSVAIVFSNGAALRFEAGGDPGSFLNTYYLPSP